ncbi:DUF3093 domain-containing protein [Longispora albida]|uniref:DUF3093 domain-containing protein n=1 Tax=Longispora albida TaxID=203523 RepID=UPI0006848655|nr:DUF3093 domain-containing protein [Longispora albida]
MGTPGLLLVTQYSHRVASRSTPQYQERLFLPWWLWLAAVGLAVLLSAELHLGAPGLREWLPYAIILPLTVLATAWLGRLRIQVADGELRVDDARLPVKFVAEATPLSPAAKRDALGVHAHPLAFVVQRPWIRDAILVTLNDPADPTPYWIISTRRPEALAAAIAAARQG